MGEGNELEIWDMLLDAAALTAALAAEAHKNAHRHGRCRKTGKGKGEPAINHAACGGTAEKKGR